MGMLESIEGEQYTTRTRLTRDRRRYFPECPNGHNAFRVLWRMLQDLTRVSLVLLLINNMLQFVGAFRH